MNIKRESMSGYQLRYAAGWYFLLDMNQTGVSYKRPMSMNETGASIWKRLEEGQSMEQIAVSLSAEYGIDKEEARQDVLEFVNQLIEYGVAKEE